MAATTAPKPEPAPAATPAPPIAILTPYFTPDPNGSTEAAFPAYPKITTPDPAATAAEATAPIAPK
jgi:hypothetical protein